MKILLSGGGTGGHIQPALAIAEALTDQVKDVEIEFCGTPNGMEASLIPKEGFPFHAIPMQGLRRSLSLRNLKAAYLTLTGSLRAARLLRRLRPDLVIGTGGYVCFPLLYAAARQGIFSALHESNAIPGLTTRMLAPHVDCVLTNFPQAPSALRAKQQYCVGNPLRKGFTVCDPRQARKRLGLPTDRTRVLLSFGGSLGAERINDTVLHLMQEFSGKQRDLIHVHACGKREYERIHSQFLNAGLHRNPNLRLVDYLYDMPTQMAAADVILCRAGALSLSELAALHKPSILVPSPYVTDDHQYKNALRFSEKGASVLIKESDLSVAEIEKAWDSIFSSHLHYKRMADAAASFSHPNASQRIAALLLSEYEKKIRFRKGSSL